MINLFTYIIFAVDIFPQNIFLDHYEVIPPLGTIKSIATSTIYLFAVSDNYLLIFDKQNLSLKRTVYFDQSIDLLAYDQGYDELWITSPSVIIRYNISLGSNREYPIPEYFINGIGVGNEYIYLEASKKYLLNKRSGEIKLVNSFPDNLRWYRRITEGDIKKYPFLTPYYYVDDPQESQTPFNRYGITAINDDGVELYIGTGGFGILKYNKISWQKLRIVYGPLDTKIRRVKKVGDSVYLISSKGISIYQKKDDNWRYLRLTNEIGDFILQDSNFVVGIGNQISQLSGSFIFPINEFKAGVLYLSADNLYIYVGTNSGLFKIYRGSREAIQFGPDRYAVYAVYPTENSIYVGTEFSFYKYDARKYTWSELINRGIKKIVELKDEFYLLSVDNQLIKYQAMPKDSLKSDTNWILLPYFNIYDIDTDKEVLYCASYAGIYYYNPTDGFYKMVYNLPRIKYNYIFVIEDNILTVSDRGVYRLPIKYRD